MSKLVFEDATKANLKARIALEGVAGGGKTWTSLSIARGLVGPDGTIGLLDTERRKASLYAKYFKFRTLPLASYSPELLIEVAAAAADQGIDCLIVDSFSHFWMGVDGMLEQVDKATARSRSQNSFGVGWKEMRPIERRMVDALLAYPGHVIVTLRTKTEWVVEQNARGRNEPKRIGTKAEQREGLEYEFDVVGSMDLENNLTITKTRFPELHGAVLPKPTVQLGIDIDGYLTDGADPAVSILALRDRALDTSMSVADMHALLAEADKAGLLRGVVIDGTGDTVTLEDLIRTKGREAWERERRIAREAAEQQAGAAE